eukprot:TRINITY_DN7028_c0_g1_i2.p1 TRINITY_DN7028_c0_g1~~TRINITY_DN7028_c0_g1_i2.p1  ORF type:complete len:209 (-),score=35.99 TRINITY_DN7028_c0_g1_i2:149-775(-)
MIISFLVICTLVEISMSYFEAVLFGFILVLLGGFILVRTMCSPEQPEQLYRIILGGVSILVILSGLFCFALQDNWHKKMTVHQKVPVYFLLGTTLSFSIIFGMGDIVNICGTRCVGDDEVPVFHTHAQIYLVVVAAVMMGAVEGLIFGLLDAEDDKYLHNQFEETRHLCVPIGGVAGTIVGILNQMFRHVGHDDSYGPVSQDDGRSDL